MAALRAQGGAYTLETVSPAGERRYAAHRRRSATCCPYEPGLARPDRARRRRRRRASSRSPSPRPATTSTPRTGSTCRLRRPGGRPRRARARPAPAARSTARSRAILRARMRRGAGPVTLLNCDNLRHNGERLRAGLLRVHRARRRRRAARLGRGAHHAARTRWSTASRRARRPSVRERVQGRHRLGRRGAGDRRELHPVGDRGRLHRRPARRGSGRRARWSSRSRRTRRPRSASSTPATAASPGPARWPGCSSSTRARTTPAIRQHGPRLRHRRRDPVPRRRSAEPDRPAGVPRRRARALRQPGDPRHQPARGDGRLLQDPRLHRADGARAAGAGRSRSTAWRCCRRCSSPSCSAGTAARCPTPTRIRHGPGRGARDLRRRRPGGGVLRRRVAVGRRWPATRGWSTRVRARRRARRRASSRSTQP